MTCSFHKFGDYFPGTGDVKVSEGRLACIAKVEVELGGVAVQAVKGEAWMEGLEWKPLAVRRPEVPQGGCGDATSRRRDTWRDEPVEALYRWAFRDYGDAAIECLGVEHAVKLA